MSSKQLLKSSDSRIWKDFKPHQGKVKRNEKGDRFYQWDYTHGDIEEYNSRGEHLGCISGTTGERTKPAVKGRTIDV